MTQITTPLCQEVFLTLIMIQICQPLQIVMTLSLKKGGRLFHTQVHQMKAGIQAIILVGAGIQAGTGASLKVICQQLANLPLLTPQTIH